LVFVAKLIDVFIARSGATPGSPWGLITLCKGSLSWKRSRRKVMRTLTTVTTNVATR